MLLSYIESSFLSIIGTEEQTYRLKEGRGSMKLSEIEVHRYALMKLDRKKLPVKVVVAIVRNLDALTTVYRETDQNRINLIRECAAKDRSGKLAPMEAADLGTLIKKIGGGKNED